MGAEIQVMAIVRGRTDVARRLVVIQGEAGTSEVFADCRPFPAVASPTAPAPGAPAQPADVAGVDLGSQEQRIGACVYSCPKVICVRWRCSLSKMAMVIGTMLP